MAKKLSSNIDYFEGYKLLGIVSQLKDYSLAYFLNQSLDIDLKKYEDLCFTNNEDQEYLFSWYFFEEEHLSANIYLISNNSRLGKLIPSKKELDFFMLFKDFPSEEYIANLLPTIRKINNVLAVFMFDLNNIKNADMLIESVEIHEIKHINKQKKKLKHM